MKNYISLWILLTLLLFAVLYLLLGGPSALPVPSIAVLLIATGIAAVIIANEMRRPRAQEYNRKKALYPRIPDKFLSKEPPAGGVIFGKDHHTGKFITEENGHVLICGSTGSGKVNCSTFAHCFDHSTVAFAFADHAPQTAFTDQSR